MHEVPTIEEVLAMHEIAVREWLEQHVKHGTPPQ